MANANYRKGANFERKFIKSMSKNYCGTRSAGSHTQIDGILIPNKDSPFSHVIVFQCKAYQKGESKPKPSEKFINLQFEGDVTKWWVTKEDRKPVEIEIV
jgi:hypothetical protein